MWDVMYAKGSLCMQVTFLVAYTLEAASITCKMKTVDKFLSVLLMSILVDIYAKVNTLTCSMCVCSILANRGHA